MTVNTDKRNPKDILVISVPAKTSAPIIHNTGNNPIFLAGTQKIEKTATGANPITRHIYQLNGTEMSGHKILDHDETYLVVLEGPWPGSTSGSPYKSALLHDDLGPSLRVTGCLPPAPIEADNSLAWLKNQALTDVTACEAAEDGIDMLLSRKGGEGKEKEGMPWRVAYLAKAQWVGIFGLPPASAYAFTADRGEVIRASVVKTPKDQIEIR